MSSSPLKLNVIVLQTKSADSFGESNSGLIESLPHFRLTFGDLLSTQWTFKLLLWHLFPASICLIGDYLTQLEFNNSSSESLLSSNISFIWYIALNGYRFRGETDCMLTWLESWLASFGCFGLGSLRSSACWKSFEKNDSCTPTSDSSEDSLISSIQESQ